MDRWTDITASLDPRRGFPMRHQRNVAGEVEMSTRGNTFGGQLAMNQLGQAVNSLSAAFSIWFVWLMGMGNWSFRCVSSAVAESVLTVN